ncbi:MAG TPA: carboxypeptidase-like regulatory domain-containing protein, partial [Planctomycetota bacterium]|nr:carboxypeptidase-like regulatory domain-containing protein [Planctomycetota bacterium]
LAPGTTDGEPSAGPAPAAEREAVASPSTADLGLVLRRPSGFVVRVVDPGGAPIERFGLKAIRLRLPDGSHYQAGDHDWPPKVGDHPGGTLELDADPRYDDFVATAPGYGDLRAAFDVGADGTSATVVLRPEGVVVGRFTFGGEPVVGGSVWLARDRIPDDPSVPEDRNDVFANGTHTDLDPFAGRRRKTTSGREGAFRFDRLAAGTYEVVVRGGGAAATYRELVRVAPGATTDVGTIEGHAPASIEGLVLLSAGLSPAGLRVSLGNDWGADEGDTVPVLADGTFELPGLSDGLHYVWLHARPGVVVQSHSQTVMLSPGERRALTVDLRSSAPGRAQVRVVREGAPVGRVHVSAQQLLGEDWEDLYVCETSPDGLAEGWVYADAPTRFEVHSPRGLLLAETERAEPSPLHEPTIELVTGTLAVRLPASPAGDAGSLGWLELTRTVNDTWLSEDEVHLQASDFEALADGTLRVEIGDVPPGRYAALLHRGVAWKGECVVVAGETAELLLSAD